MSNLKVILIHGNGGSNSSDVWLPEVQRQLEALGLEVINHTFPDNVKARSKYWLPYLTELGAGADTVLIGHSSGAVAAMRYAETHQLYGSVLVGACYTDLGEPSERISGYYDTDWDWDAISRHQEFILQFASPDDPYIPITEPRYIQKQLGSKYHELAKKGHFLDNSFPELIKALRKELKV